MWFSWVNAISIWWFVTLQFPAFRFSKNKMRFSRRTKPLPCGKLPLRPTDWWKENVSFACIRIESVTELYGPPIHNAFTAIIRIVCRPGWSRHGMREANDVPVVDNRFSNELVDATDHRNSTCGRGITHDVWPE